MIVIKNINFDLSIWQIKKKIRIIYSIKAISATLLLQNKFGENNFYNLHIKYTAIANAWRQPQRVY